MSKKVCIAGASGFIGKNLREFLERHEYKISIIGRNDFITNDLQKKIEGCDVLVNLIGESISGIWTKGKKKKIFNSRIGSTRKLVDLINTCEHTLKLFVNVSGVGIYDQQHRHDEESIFLADDFLGRVIMSWEKEVTGIKRDNMRVIIMRMGLILGANGGVYRLISGICRLGIGFTINSNENFPFIHLKDLLRIFLWILEQNDISGTINVVSPNEISIRNFFTLVAKINHCRICFRLSPGMLRFMMGESSVLLIHGQHVIPQKLINSGFSFKFAEAGDALQNLKR